MGEELGLGLEGFNVAMEGASSRARVDGSHVTYPMVILSVYFAIKTY